MIIVKILFKVMVVLVLYCVHIYGVHGMVDVEQILFSLTGKHVMVQHQECILFVMMVFVCHHRN
jgi:hypothetical protein